MSDAMSETQRNLFSQGIPLSEAPEDQRRAFEVWVSLIGDYLERLNDDKAWGYFEARSVGMIIVLQSQLSKEIIPQGRLDQLAGKAASALGPVMEKSPNDFDTLEINDLIQGYFRKRASE